MNCQRVLAVVAFLYAVGHAAECEPAAPVESESIRGWSLLAILLMLFICVIVTYIITAKRLRFLPESLAVVLIGVLVGVILRFVPNLQQLVVSFDSDTFFLFLLPPIIFESGYSLHKESFFKNFGSICVFAVFGTIISTIIVGIGVYLVGLAGASAPLPLSESLVFGALISAVDPVATLAVFHALEVHPQLNTLVFGESVVNDAVAIVLFNTLVQFVKPNFEFTSETALAALGEFGLVSLGSIAIGVVLALLSAVLLKKLNFNEHPALELSVVFIFAYAPYLLADSLKLSGIMAVLFGGITMAHYTYFNLSPISQLSSQYVFRMMAFVSETAIFGYLGIALFSFDHKFDFGLISLSIILCLIGRAFNIFPLSFAVNLRRSIKISRSHQVIMWFSGLRGAIAFALALRLPTSNRAVLVTTTLVIVLFTIIIFGGGTLPLLRVMKIEAGGVTFSKTENTDAHQSDDNDASPTRGASSESVFSRIDKQRLRPFFRRIHSRETVATAHAELQKFTNLWYSHLRSSMREEPSTPDTRMELINENSGDGSGGGGGWNGRDAGTGRDEPDWGEISEAPPSTGSLAWDASERNRRNDNNGEEIWREQGESALI